MVNCPKCGSYNPTGSNFCSECGSSMDTNSNKSKVRKIKVESHDPKKPIGGISTNENKEKGDNSGKYICIGLIILILVGVFFFGGNSANGDKKDIVRELEIQETLAPNHSVYIHAVVELPDTVGHNPNYCEVIVWNDSGDAYAGNKFYSGNFSEDGSLLEINGYLKTGTLGTGKPTMIDFVFEEGEFEKDYEQSRHYVKDSEIVVYGDVNK